MDYAIDRSGPVLVTGATGFVAGWIIRRLLEEGVTVHATVRDPGDAGRLRHLNALPRAHGAELRFFGADLLGNGSFAEAMAGCGVVFHTASPFTSTVKDPERELIEPALLGTRNVLNQARKTDSVRRVVLTSSCAAIYTDAADCADAPGGILTEAIWNATASLEHQPYSLSKTLAEAHLAAAFLPDAEGRNIVAAHDADLLSALMTLQPKYGRAFRLPTRAAPKFLLWLLAPRLGLTRKFVSRNVDVPWRADNGKGRRELGLTYRPLQDTMQDMFQYMIDQGYFQARI